MDVLILNHREVRQLLPMHECIAALEQVFVTLANGDALQPLRWPMFLPDRSGLLGMMPGYVGGDINMMGIKTVSVMPGNHGTEYDSHQGTIMLFEKTHGVLKAIVDATEVTSIRTAAASGVATKLLARDDACNLAIIGSGVQARSHLTAMLAVRNIKRVRAFSPNQTRLEAFSAWGRRTHQVEVELTDDTRSAVDQADIICTTTSASTPILLGDWIADGAHINAVGSSVKSARELDTAAVLRSDLYVDWRVSTINEAGDFLFPKQEGVIDESHILAELGELLIGAAAGRTSTKQVTLFKSLGLAVEDIAAAHLVYQKATARGAGTYLEIGAKKDI
ncbi:MAG: ornithine cyclodeaminase family protein [Chloroflexota bacterium]